MAKTSGLIFTRKVPGSGARTASTSAIGGAAAAGRNVEFVAMVPAASLSRPTKAPTACTSSRTVGGATGEADTTVSAAGLVSSSCP